MFISYSFTCLLRLRMFYDSVSCLKRPLSCVEFSEMVFFFKIPYSLVVLWWFNACYAWYGCKNEWDVQVRTSSFLSSIWIIWVSKKTTQRQGAISYLTISVTNLYFGDFEYHIVFLWPLFLKLYVMKESVHVASVLPEW